MCGNGGKSQPGPEAEVTKTPFSSVSCSAHEANGLRMRLAGSELGLICTLLSVFFKDGFTGGFRSNFLSTICAFLHIKHKTKWT